MGPVKVMRLLGIAVASLSMLLVAATPSLAINWETAIKKVDNSSSEYYDYVRDKGGDTWVGTAYNGFEYRHLAAEVCASDRGNWG